MTDWTLIREQYEAGEKTVGMICAEHKLSTTTLYKQIRIENWLTRSQLKEQPEKASAPEDRSKERRKRKKRSTDRKALIDRLYFAFEQQIGDLEAHLSLNMEEGVTEKDARTLGSLARTLEKLIELRQDEEGTAEATDSEVDIERLLEEIARRLERVREKREIE